MNMHPFRTTVVMVLFIGLMTLSGCGPSKEQRAKAEADSTKAAELEPEQD